MSWNRSVRDGFPLQKPHWPFPTISLLSMCQLSLTILTASFRLLNWTWDLLGYFPGPSLQTGVTLATSHSSATQQFTDLGSTLCPVATSSAASYPNSIRVEEESHLFLLVSYYPFHQFVKISLPPTLPLESVPQTHSYGKQTLCRSFASLLLSKCWGKEFSIFCGFFYLVPKLSLEVLVLWQPP